VIWVFDYFLCSSDVTSFTHTLTN